MTQQQSRRAVFLDRDGVLAEAIVRADGKAYAPTALADFTLVPDAAEQVRRLREAGLLRIVFTNQPELANKLLHPDVLEEMHRIMRDALPLDDVYVCPHDKSEGCRCHKPATGMLLDAAETWVIDLSRSFVIGDRWRDIGAGKAAGCFSILLERPYSACDDADLRVGTLAEAVDAVLARIGPGGERGGPDGAGAVSGDGRPEPSKGA
jgi:D-glycero-D-manno-heptose 1,7-bisphosphate phosphatase